MVTVFTNSPGDRGSIFRSSHTKHSKTLCDDSLLKTHRIKGKWSNLENGVRVVAIQKGAFSLPSTTVGLHNTYVYIFVKKASRISSKQSLYFFFQTLYIYMLKYNFCLCKCVRSCFHVWACFFLFFFVFFW